MLTRAVTSSLIFGSLIFGACETSSAPPPERGDDDDDSTEESPRPRDAGTARDASVNKPRDAAPPDPGSDAEAPITGRKDGGRPDAGRAPDAGSAACVPFSKPADLDCKNPSDGVLPKDLRCTGLYGDFEQRQLACGVLEYKPAYELWSDDAQKRRFVSIPAGEKVNVSDPDEFEYPEGTRFWKEFQVAGADGKPRLAETRLLEKRAAGWVYTSYVWNEQQTEAIQMKNADGVRDLYGTGHDVPTRDQCKDCHSGREEFVLGWDALMLGPGASGVTRDNLAKLGLADNVDNLALTIPGDEVERAALGYLHANCGISCHNDNKSAPANETELYLRLEADDLDRVESTDAYESGLNKEPAVNAKLEGLPEIDGEWLAIRPGDPARSLLVARQKLRGFEGQMPRLGTRKVDEVGVAAVERWIESMSQSAR